MTDNIMLDHALAYARKGWRVFPCGRDKKPLTTNGFKDATTDPDQLASWWSRWPDASIGCPTGPGVGTWGAWVLDVDLPDGPESLARLEADHGALPATLEQQTGGGGRQLFFRWPFGREVRNSTSKVGPKLDVRGEGGYVIVPPSGHPSGGRYAWTSKTSMAAAPGWLIDMVCSLPKPETPKAEPRTRERHAGTSAYARAALDAEISKVASAPAGTRNAELNRAAHALGQLVGGGELSESEAVDALLDAARAAGLPEGEAAKTIRSGLAAGMREPRTAPEGNRRRDGGGADHGQASDQKDAPDQGPRHAFAGLDFEACNAGSLLAAPCPELTWTFRDFLLSGTVGLLVGPPGTGKSILANHLAAAVACGCGAEGVLEPGQTGKVLVLAGEEDARIVPRRLRRLFEHLFPDGGGPEAEAFKSNMLVVPLAATRLRLLEKTGPAAPAVSEVFDELLTRCKAISGLRLIVVDPLARFFGLEENDNTAATIFAEALERLAAETGASVLVLHHVNKGAMRGPKTTFRDSLEMTAARGASGFVGAVRAQMNIVTLSAAEARKELRPSEPPTEGEYLAVGFPKCSYGRPRGLVYLRRLAGGVLTAMTPPVDEAAQKLEGRLVEMIVAEVARREESGEPPLTIKVLGDVFPARWKDDLPGATKTAVRAAAQGAILDGGLHIITRKGGDNRPHEYLATTPDTGQTPDRHRTDTGQRTPDSTGQKARPVTKSSVYAASHTGQREHRTESPSVPGTRANPTPDTGQDFPLKGRVPPSGAANTPLLWDGPSEVEI